MLRKEAKSKERKKKWEYEKENMTLVGSKIEVREPERKKEGGEDDIAGLLMQITRICSHRAFPLREGGIPNKDVPFQPTSISLHLA